ncbi:MAG: DegT/DnrJ/EryC1/StrS family aminotransferase [Candidatus Binatia bacterium]
MEPWFGEEEKRAVCEYLEAGGWITEFEKTWEFERIIADYVGSRHCIVVNNGTVSLTLAALACCIEAGDEVIVPNYTMIATPNSVRMLEAVPKLLDVERETLCLDIGKTEQAVTDKTKAVFLVSTNGRYPKAGVDSFVQLCQEHNLVLVEDAAQALGSFYPNGRHIGTMGRMGSFSFSVPKIISTGQGGAIVTDDDIMAARIRKLKDFGRSKRGTDIHDCLGYNFKFTDIQACVGIEQMKKLPWRVQRKKEIYSLYRKELQSFPQIEFFDQDLKHTTPWFIDVLADNRDELQQHLKQKGVGTRVMYPPINEQKAYGWDADCPVSRMVGEKGLWLPSASQLTDAQVTEVCELIRRFYTAN